MMVEKAGIQIVKEEPPRELNYKNVVYWSEHYKRLEGIEHGKAIQIKAKLFLKNGSIEYDPNESKYDPYGSPLDGHRFICKPIIGYNSTTYRMWIGKPNGEDECSCQFYQKTKMQCSHLTALFLWLKIRNWNRRNSIE